MAKKSFPLRIDERIFDQMRAWADEEFRSVNGQIEYVLREALRGEGRSKQSKVLTSEPESSDTDEGE